MATATKNEPSYAEVAAVRRLAELRRGVAICDKHLAELAADDAKRVAAGRLRGWLNSKEIKAYRKVRAEILAQIATLIED